jgi:hypothetical protein
MNLAVATGQLVANFKFINLQLNLMHLAKLSSILKKKETKKKILKKIIKNVINGEYLHYKTSLKSDS